MNKPSPKTLFIITSSVCITLILAVFILCICMFVNADRTSNRAWLTERAVTETSSIAETLKASDGDLQKTGQLMREHKMFDASDDTLLLYYNEELRPAVQTDSPYMATVTKTASDHYISYEITIFDRKQDNVIYSLSFKALQKGDNQQ